MARISENWREIKWRNQEYQNRSATKTNAFRGEKVDQNHVKVIEKDKQILLLKRGQL